MSFCSEVKLVNKMIHSKNQNLLETIKTVYSETDQLEEINSNIIKDRVF